jgi:alkaline phosphatase D
MASLFVFSGKYYSCLIPSQNEFVKYFNVPSSDPRHPDKGSSQQHGVYNSRMFSKAGGANGIHAIFLDARHARSPTYADYGPCNFGRSKMLDEVQWSWLQTELQKTSVIKIIASGTQIMSPTYRSRPLTDYCSYDGVGGSFDAANSAVGEDSKFTGTVYESWSEMPQERTRLLQLAQKSINDGFSKKIIFISGDQHWAEIMAKKMPASDLYGASQILYEITASGIDQSYVEDVKNSNRVRVRTADSMGNGFFDRECNFPFIYKGVTYSNCTSVDRTQEWCSLETDSNNNHVSGRWGNCLPENEELVPRNNIFYTGANICSDNYLHVCSAEANYGGISVDWNQNKLTLALYTPHSTQPLAASVVVDF